MNRKILLDESDIPTHWYNIVADMPNKPLPPLNPQTKEPVGPEDLSPIFPMAGLSRGVRPWKSIKFPKRGGRTTASGGPLRSSAPRDSNRQLERLPGSTRRKKGAGAAAR